MLHCLRAAVAHYRYLRRLHPQRLSFDDWQMVADLLEWSGHSLNYREDVSRVVETIRAGMPAEYR
jgi:hypothetical protein